MKKNLLCLTFFLTISFFLSGLQASLYFLPVPLPHFWIIVLTYYSFQKPIVFSLSANLFHILVLASFSSTLFSIPLLVMNVLTLSFHMISQRFNTTWTHLSFAAGFGSLTYHVLDWFLAGMVHAFAYPSLFTWASTSLVTFLFTPVLTPILHSVDKRIHYDRVDTLENLRV